MTINFPKWVWWIVGGVLVIFAAWVLKVDINVGQGGFHFTCGLFK